MSRPPSLETNTLTPARVEIYDHQVDFFRENGYLVIEDALTPEEVAQLRQETVRICRGELGPVTGLPPVGPGDSDDQVIQRTLCIHFPHKLSPVMFDALAKPTIVEVMTQVIGPNVKCMQSMLFIKSAGKPGQAWHQDEMFIPTRDRSLNAAWMALGRRNPRKRLSMGHSRLASARHHLARPGAR